MVSHDREAAMARLQTVADHENGYAFPGEARVAKAMMEKLLENYMT